MAIAILFSLKLMNLAGLGSTSVGRSSLKTKSTLYGSGAGKNMGVALTTAQMNAVVREKAQTSLTVLQIVSLMIKMTSLLMMFIPILLYSSVLGQQKIADSKMCFLTLHTKLGGVKQ